MAPLVGSPWPALNFAGHAPRRLHSRQVHPRIDDRQEGRTGIFRALSERPVRDRGRELATIVDAASNSVVLGGSPSANSATIQEIVSYLDEG
jgi:hypothetical protein